MSNYLNGLIARSRGHSSRVAPRLRSAFEPAAAAVTDPLSLLTRDGMNVAEANSLPAAATPPTPEADGAPPSPVTVPSSSFSAAALAATVRPTPISVDDRARKALAEDSLAESHDYLLLPLRAPQAEPSSLFAPPQPAKKQVPAHTGPLEQSSAAGSGNKGDAMEGAAGLSARHTAGEPRTASVPARATVPRHSPKAAGVPVSNRDRLQSRKGDSAPPAIHVTIGRVDVRALFPSAAPAPNRFERPTPKITLEKYLEARNGGGK